MQITPSLECRNGRYIASSIATVALLQRDIVHNLTVKLDPRNVRPSGKLFCNTLSTDTFGTFIKVSEFFWPKIHFLVIYGPFLVQFGAKIVVLVPHTISISRAMVGPNLVIFAVL